MTATPPLTDEECGIRPTDGPAMRKMLRAICEEGRRAGLAYRAKYGREHPGRAGDIDRHRESARRLQGLPVQQPRE